MGEAARRKQRERTWREALDDEERVVVRVAEALSELMPPYGACYQATFFLRYHLATVHGILGDAVVGFANDGTDDLYGSHAWFMFNGKITDLAISRPLRPEVQRPGPLTIQGFEVRPGWPWTYHLAEPPEGRVIVEKLLADPRFRQQIQAEQELRNRMVSISDDLEAMRKYLDAADNGLTYERLSAEIS